MVRILIFPTEFDPSSAPGLTPVQLHDRMVNISPFQHNGRGLSFEVEINCRKAGTPVYCSTEFNKSTGAVVKLGHVSRGRILANPDIAGYGVRLHSNSGAA